MPFDERKQVMKGIFKRLTGLVIPFLLIGCTGIQPENSSSAKKPTSSTAPTSSTSKPSSSSAPSSSSSVAPHVHTWSEDWASDGTTHWHYCTGCDAKKDIAAHVSGEEGFLNPVNKGLIKFPNPKKGSACTICGAFKATDSDILPKLTFK